jgi:hypothetical protein
MSTSVGPKVPDVAAIARSIVWLGDGESRIGQANGKGFQDD